MKSLVLSLVLSILAGPAGGQMARRSPADARQVLVPPDGHPFGRFGSAVAAWGDTIVVGAATDATNQPGRAYVFRRDRRDAPFELVQEIFPGGSGSSFGERLALEGDVLAVGAPAQGTTYVYLLDGAGVFDLQRALTAYGNPGFDVDLQGDRLVVGAPDPYCNPFLGCEPYPRVDVHRRDLGGANEWGLAQSLTPMSSVQYAGCNHLGSAVAIDGNRLVAGAPFDGTYCNTGQTGSVHVYEQEPEGTGSWVHLVELEPSPSQVPSSGSWGGTVDVRRELVVMGGAVRTPTPPYFLYAVQIWSEGAAGSGRWEPVRVLVDPRPDAGSDVYGAAIVLGRDRLYVGAPDDERMVTADTEGIVYVHGRNLGGPEGWGIERVLRAPVPQNGDGFGASIALGPGLIVVGATERKVGAPATAGQGRAYVFPR